MKRSTDELQIFSYLTKIKATCTVVAATDIITSASHGLRDGDIVQFTTTTTLPAGLSLLTNYYVKVIDANTFYVSSSLNGSTVDITDTGTGTHSFNLKGRTIECEDFKHLVVSVHTSGSANMTYKFQGSNQKGVNFHVAQSTTNRWSYLRSVDLDSGTYVAGATGYSPAGTDENRTFEINTNGIKYICIAITAFTAGTMEANVKKFANDNI